MTKTVSHLGTIHLKTGGMILVRLPKILLKKYGITFKHKERVRISISGNGNIITIRRYGKKFF